MSWYLAVGKQKYLLPKSEIQTLFIVCTASSQVTIQNTFCGTQHAGLQYTINIKIVKNTLKKHK